MKIHYVNPYLLNPTHRITVAVIGVGGNGSQALNDLAKIHYSLIALDHPGLYVYAIDNDIVDGPNIGRQKFSEADIGDYKASALITRLNRFYGLDWIAIPEKFKGQEYCSANFIISCVDNVKTRNDIHDFFIKYQNYSIDYRKTMYWMDFGNGKDFGQFVLGSSTTKQPKSKFETVKVLKNVFDLFPNMEKHENLNDPSCSIREALSKQDLFINSILVNTGMNLLWKMFTEYKINTHGGYVNLTKGTSNPIKL